MGEHTGRYRDGKLLCSGTSKQTGKPCRAFAMKGKEVCKNHGGESPTGMASPNYKHGRRSRALPDRMLANFVDAQTDTRLLELRDNIATLEARELDLLSQVATGNSTEMWKQLRVQYVAVRRLLFETPQSNDPDVQREQMEALSIAMAEIDRLTTEGANEWLTWKEAEKVAEQKRRFIDSERRYLLQMESLYTSQEVIALTQRFLDLARTTIIDDRDRKLLIEGIHEIIATEKAR